MRVNACLGGLAILCFALTACGGGSGDALPAYSGAGQASSAPQSTPTAQPSPSAYPGSSGDMLQYTGTLTQTFKSYPEVVAPGTPSPEPVSVTKLNVSESISVKANQTFAGTSGLIGLHSSETDAQSSGLKTVTTQTDTYEGISDNGVNASPLRDYGFSFADEGGDTTSVTYSPAQMLDQLPETPGATWSNGAGESQQEALAGNAAGSPVTVQRDVNADGSYTERTTYPKGYSAPGYTGVGQIAQNSDGSGSFAWVANDAATTILYSVPVPQPSGPPLVTVSVYNGLDPTPVATPNSAFQLPTWYGSAPALYNERDRDLGVVTVPASCSLASSLPQQATRLERTIDRTDTVLGYTDSERTTTYVAPGYGALCTLFDDTQTLYYDFNGDQPFVFTQIPPLEVITTSETLTLQPNSYIAGTRTAQSSDRMERIDVAPALRTAFRRHVGTLRDLLRKRLVRAVNAIKQPGENR